VELKDFVVTPIVIFIVYALAYMIRPKVTDENTKRYFIPALTVKIIGALAVGFIYQFYYGGGDTFAYHTHGSRVIWEAFMDDPMTGVKLLFANGEYEGSTFKYSSQIWYYKDWNSYFIIRIASIFDLMTFGTYTATAILFSVFCFSGIWALYLTFYKRFKKYHFGLAVSILFIPTVVFWGSGILKDTITLGALGWLIYSFDEVVINKNIKLSLITILILSIVFIYNIKIYILLSILPPLLVWFYLQRIGQIKPLKWRIIIAPIVLLITIALGYLIVNEVSKENPRYKLNRLAETARITAYDIRFGWGARFGDNSGYYLGELDGSFSNMISLMPAAINVTLFRPYLWEVRNPLMLLSAVESLCIFILTVFVMIKVGLGGFIRSFLSPEIAFCLLFALIFAFAVGISTYNFGSLSRYKIPMLPFYITSILLVHYKSKNK